MKYTEGPNLSISIDVMAIEDAYPGDYTDFMEGDAQPPLWNTTPKGCATVTFDEYSGEPFIWIDLKNKRWQTTPMADIAHQVALEFEEWVTQCIAERKAELAEEATE